MPPSDRRRVKAMRRQAGQRRFRGWGRAGDSPNPVAKRAVGRFDRRSRGFDLRCGVARPQLVRAAISIIARSEVRAGDQRLCQSAHKSGEHDVTDEPPQANGHLYWAL
jgi:hypothetical protein